jgi:serine/threonine-protein kinase
MELLEGQSLQERLDRGPVVGEVEFLEIADRVLDVLKGAHARGVVHRDLKPENLFLVDPRTVASAGASVKVLDFGLARLLDGETITNYGLALGTPPFMSPEQAAGRIDEIDGRTDLFALAATGFRLRTGRRIHRGGNAIELVRKMANLAAPRIHSVAIDVSTPYARVVDRALAFRREDRYPNAEAMQKDVRRALRELDAGAGPTQPALPAAWLSPVRARDVDHTTLGVKASDRAGGGVQATWKRPWRRRAAVASLVLMVVTAIGVRSWIGRRARSPDKPEDGGLTGPWNSATGSPSAGAATERFQTAGTASGEWLGGPAPSGSAHEIGPTAPSAEAAPFAAPGATGTLSAESAVPVAPPSFSGEANSVRASAPAPSPSRVRGQPPGQAGPGSVHKMKPQKHRPRT